MKKAKQPLGNSVAAMELTVVITNWQRLSNVDCLLRELTRQEGVRFCVIVWDQSDGINQSTWWNEFHRQQQQSPFVSGLFLSSHNYKCSARWFVAANASTPYVLIIDDDLGPSDTQVLADTVAALEKLDGAPIGAWGVKLESGKRYHNCRHFGEALNGRPYEPVASDTTVDIIRGRFFAVAVDRLAKLPMRLPDLDDDIAVSACLGGGTVLASLQGRFKELPTGSESIACRSGHMQHREATRRQWFNAPVAATVHTSASR